MKPPKDAAARALAERVYRTRADEPKVLPRQFEHGRPGNRITEDMPEWNPRTMGNKSGGSAGYYRKRGRPGPD